MNSQSRLQSGTLDRPKAFCRPCTIRLSATLNQTVASLWSERQRQRFHPGFRKAISLKDGLVARRRGDLLLAADSLTDEGFEDLSAFTLSMEALAGEVKELLKGTSLYLVGMMGSGKTTVGKLVGTAIRYPFLDVDKLIEQASEKSVADIFSEEGEEGFREMETQTLQELMQFKGIVVGTGGGTVLKQKNWSFMQHGVVIWLEGPPGLLARRALKDGTASRPLLSSAAGPLTEAEVEEKLQAILEQRQRLYESADIRVSVDGSDGDNSLLGAPSVVVAYRVMKLLKERLLADAEQREADRKFTINEETPLAGMRVLNKVAETEGAAPDGTAAPSA
eukprot:jgi/Botrbrau1/3040/Bobra.0070s0036.1